MPTTVRLITLGCAKNEVDSEEIAGVLQRAGYQLDARTDAPDVVIINTCGFLESAQREGLQVIREALQLKRQGKTQRVIVAGCMVQRLGESLKQMLPEVDAWVGVGQMARFAEIVDSARLTRQTITDIQPPHHRWADVPTRLRSRAPWTAYLKVSEGCDHKCTFCTIPSFRGRHVSKPIERVLEEARWLAANGAKELNLIAQDTTQYGYDLYKKFMLPTLLRELNAIEGVEWIRIHYAYPSRITDELIEAMASLPKVAKYLDVPLQHADAKVLRAMRRPGDGERYLKMIQKLRAAMPEIAIRTTFIVGFPGEGESEFQNLLDFMQAAQLDRVGAFIYSREKGTPSAEMPDQVPFRVKRERFDKLMRFQQPISLARNQQLVGKTVRVLIESHSEDGKYAIGRSHRDAPDVDGLVYVRNGVAQAGEFVDVKITQADVYDVWGELQPSSA
ncbi:MAG: 30S ribosomal protein S12 methylthiotransferase RimO [Fimbriimonadales bacterium]|nr:30S ribosomal protein S12 methylthiotransferase RimO [Fimbriimonadales bacterium]